MTTELIYLEDQSLLTCSAIVQDIVEVEKNIVGIVLNKTVFYVQGGGQPGDCGVITHHDKIFNVTKTVKDESHVLHIGSFFGDRFEVTSEVELKVDKASRDANSRLHSAGHLIDMAVRRVGLYWTPIKGCHFPGACSIEYSFQNNSEDRDDLLKEKIQEEYDSLVMQDIQLEITIDHSQVYHGVPLRQVSFSGQSRNPCGGTHVRSTGQLKGIRITKVKTKNGTAKINYQ